MAHKLPPLPYAYDALEPHIDARTMEIHHTKHHNGYVTNLNAALEGHAGFADTSVESLLGNIAAVPDSARQAVINHGGGHANHTLFWQIMGPHKGGEPKSGLADAIKSTFGDFPKFKDQFTKTATTLFGSGWTWLCVNAEGKLCLCTTRNQENPLMKGVVDCPGTPILGLDVWEHAYYLKYQNRRPEYIAAWWNVVNWDKVAEFYAAARRR
jgi:Fe-Mn family superoxide dismutase